MRKLLIIGICLLIVTLAVGADARDRNSRDSNNSSASSRDSSSSSDRQSGVSKDRQNAPSSDTSNRRSSASSSENNRTTSSGYRPSGRVNTVTRSEAGPSSSSSSGSNRSAYSGYRPSTTPNTTTRSEIKPPSSDSNRQIYRPGSGSASSGNSDTGRISSRNTRSVDPVYPAYRPGTQQKVDIQPNTRTTTTTDSRRTGDIYSAYRPNTSSRSIDPVPTVNHGTQSGRTLYNPNKNADTSNSIGRPSTYSGGQNRDRTGSDATSYRPTRGNDSSSRSNTTLGNQTRNQDHSGYRSGNGAQANQLPTTRSVRDRKLADARTSSFGSYRPSTNRSFTYANYSQPKGYRPPNYRSGQYYYSTPRYTRPCSFGFWSFDYYQGYSRRSMYFHYGLFPYIAITRIILDSYPTVVYVDQPIYSTYGTSYEGTRYPGLDDALADVRSAWVSGRCDLIQEHVQDSYDIAVLLDGKYDYSVTADDYLAMTQDALGEMDTMSFSWNKVQSRRDGTVTAFATHTYRSGDSTRRVYVSFTLQRVGSRYYIVEVGSTQSAWN